MEIDSVCYLCAQLCNSQIFPLCNNQHGEQRNLREHAPLISELQLRLSALHSLRAYVLFQALSPNLTANIGVTLTAIIARVVLVVVAVAAIIAAVIAAIVRAAAIIAVTVGGDWWQVNFHLVSLSGARKRKLVEV